MNDVTPIYLYRRNGQQAWATCHLERFEELRGLAMFSTMLAYDSDEYAAIAAERNELRAQVEELKHQLETLRVGACKNDGK